MKKIIIAILFLAAVAADAKPLPVPMAPGWERAPQQIEDENQTWFLGRSVDPDDPASAFVRLFIPWNTEKAARRHVAEKRLNTLVRELADAKHPRVTKQYGPSWMTIRAQEEFTDEQGDKNRFIVAIWNGKKIRILMFEIDKSAGSRLPYFCEDMIAAFAFPGKPARETRVLEAANGFQTLLHENFDALGEHYLTPHAAKTLNGLNELLIHIPPMEGWKTLIKEAIITHCGNLGKKSLISYYHPYSDILILTAWQTHPESLRILMEDAVMMDGYYIRDGALETPSGIPLWIRQKKMTPPVAMGLLTWRTLNGVREKGSVLLSAFSGDPDLKTARHLVCYAYFLFYADNLARFYQDPVVPMRTFHYLERLHKRDPKLFTDASDFDKNSPLRGLMKLSKGYIETLTPRIYFKHSQWETVLLASPKATGAMVMLTFDRSGNPLPSSEGIINIQDMLTHINQSG